jgi:hypothetical protein
LEGGANHEIFKQEEAPRYDRRQPDAARVDKNHEILGKAGVTGLTPLGRGKSKAATIRHENYGDIINRNNACAGCTVRLYDDSKVANNKKVGYKTKGFAISVGQGACPHSAWGASAPSVLMLTAASS